MKEISICHLYPDILNLYGDRGNIIAMTRRLEWRGIAVYLNEVPLGEPLDYGKYDIFFIGGGQDFEQQILLKDLSCGKSAAIKDAVEAEKTFLCICAGYQLMGSYYKTRDNIEIPFIGAMDFHTIGQTERMIGDYMFICKPSERGMAVVGFENHSGKTYLGSGVRPLGEVLKGFGNNGEDLTEGARYKNVFCSYAHGSLLPKNPMLCDHILKTALYAKYGEFELPILDDFFENKAHAYISSRLSR